jgi:hypothetical protein
LILAQARLDGFRNSPYRLAPLDQDEGGRARRRTNVQQQIRKHRA